jgi:hypothetical protein
MQRRLEKLYNQKTHKTNKEEQYKKILKQIQGNPAKTKYKGKSKQKIKQRKQNTGKPKKI